jgi:histidine triad (HIT) family protein
VISGGSDVDEQATCFVCRKHRGLEIVPGGAVFEDNLVFSGHSWLVEDAKTPYLGGFIVEPKRHVPTWAELSDDEAGRMGRVIRDVSRALNSVLDAEHIYVFVVGHQVHHLHVWVLPRYRDTPREYWGFQIFDWPDLPQGTESDVEQLCAQIRAAMG